jgi:hypothetical protein
MTPSSSSRRRSVAPPACTVVRTERVRVWRTLPPVRWTTMPLVNGERGWVDVYQWYDS